MRKAIPEPQKCKTKSVSLPPKLSKFANQRSFSADMSFSKYVQKLIEFDLQNNVLPKALTSFEKAV
jgi:hypothetical protein